MAERDIRAVDVAMLRTFDALMRERSVSRAAARLFLSQPAVSASLNRLRQTFGDALFTRTPHGVQPTARAHELAPAVERVLAELAAMVEGGGAFDPAASQRIFRIGGSDHASRLMLPPLARALTASGSGIRLFWETGGMSVLTERLRKGDVDVAVLPRTEPPRDLDSALLYSDRYVLAARRGHPHFAAAPGLELFCTLPHVVLGYGLSMLDDLIDEALRREGKKRLSQIALTTFGQIVDVLAATDHLAVLPQRVALAHAERLATQPLPIALPDYQLHLCWLRRSGADAGIAWLRDALADGVSAIRTSCAAPASPSPAAAGPAPRVRRRAAPPAPEAAT